MRLQALIRGFLVLGLMVSPAAFAEEIIYFTNGTTMAIVKHVVDEEKGSIQVDLGSNGFIAFPMSRVERIERAGANVYLSPSHSTEVSGVRKAAGGSSFKLGGSGGGGAAPVAGGTRPSSRGSSRDVRERQRVSLRSAGGMGPVGTNGRGMAVRNKAANNPNRSVRKLGATAGAVGRSNTIGAMRRGNHSVVNTASSNNPRNPVTNPVTRLQLKGSATSGDAPGAGDAGSGDAGSSSGTGSSTGTSSGGSGGSD